MERNHDTLTITSVVKSHRGYYTEDFWNIRNLGTFTALFFMIAQESYLYREVL